MKKTLFVLTLICSLSAVKAQLTGAGIGQQYGNFMLNVHTQFNRAQLADFIPVGGDKRFFDNKWLNGGVTNNFEYTLSDGFKFNYDFIKQELSAKWNDTSIVVDNRTIKRFYLDDNINRHYFVKNIGIDGKGKYFFESLAYDEVNKDSSGFQLLKLRTVKQIRANKNDYLANFSGDYSDSYDNTIEYYLVSPDKTYSKIKLNRKSLQSAYEKVKGKSALNFSSVPDNLSEAEAAALVLRFNQ